MYKYNKYWALFGGRVFIFVSSCISTISVTDSFPLNPLHFHTNHTFQQKHTEPSGRLLDSPQKLVVSL
jgi:hypothetical protein